MFNQVMPERHPLVCSSGDGGRPGLARGQAIKSYGGTWHVVQAG